MPREALVYRGWIGAKESDKSELEAMGVEVHAWNPIGAFDVCRMTADVFRVFEKRWNGYRVWGMIARTEVVYTKKEMEEQLEDVPF